jgi:hydrogenase maturation protein HypF
MYKLTVTGTVQGVGFRPFVYRVSKALSLRGYVRNTGNGSVEILIDKNPEKLISVMKKECPPFAHIEKIKVEKINRNPPEDFFIWKSTEGTGEISLPPPDIAICDNCLEELFDSRDRRFSYPFISCTNCGPRFSVTKQLPFDRANTSFSEFPLCEECTFEYQEMTDRRYYAQSIACGECGPDYMILGRNERGIKAIQKVARFIDSGKIVAIKGYGGYHIACLVDRSVVERLREMLKRPQQPFAVMVRDIEKAKQIAEIDELNAKEIQSFIRPIMVVKKRQGVDFSAVAPGLDTIGIILPYAPLHHLLYHFLHADVVVMTSANMPGEPMYIDEKVSRLPVDAILSHNLEIVNRVDDSVIKIVNERRLIIRRSRGFVPSSLNVDLDIKAIAVGAELYNSITAIKNKKAVISQYIGNTGNYRTFKEFFMKAVDHLMSLIRVDNLDVIFSDFHPQYNTSIFAEKYSKKMDCKLVKVQHHFAHAMSVMAEKEMERAIAIAVDGAGYGFDGNSWGGEVLLLDFENGDFRRLGHIEGIQLIGGDLATRFPLRILFSIIYGKTKSWDVLEPYETYLRAGESFDIFSAQMDKHVATPIATSAGRYMDAISAMLELCFERTYEGEPAMKLEAIAKNSESYYKPDIKTRKEISRFSSPCVEEDLRMEDGRVKILEVSGVICDSLERYLAGEPKGELAFQMIDYLAKGLGEIATKMARKYCADIVMSGGVVYNSYFTEIIERLSEEDGISVFTPEQVPCGDNGISFGQIYSGKYLERM